MTEATFYNWRKRYARLVPSVCREVSYPQSVRVDKGSEFISRGLDLWAYQKREILDFSRLGDPTENAFIKSFNGKLRAECLNTHSSLALTML